MTDIEFASEAAKTKADDYDVEPDALAVTDPSGDGGYTVADVDHIIATRTGEDAYGGADRVFLARGYDFEDDHGNRRVMRGGEFYRPSPEIAQELLKMKYAYPEGSPPQCFYCTESFEGENAFKRRDEHIEEAHRDREE